MGRRHQRVRWGRRDDSWGHQAGEERGTEGWKDDERGWRWKNLEGVCLSMTLAKKYMEENENNCHVPSCQNKLINHTRKETWCKHVCTVSVVSFFLKRHNPHASSKQRSNILKTTILDLFPVFYLKCKFLRRCICGFKDQHQCSFTSSSGFSLELWQQQGQ